MKTRIITAICTPLKEDQTLHLEGLEAHIADQWQHGISGLLVAGTMGLMQLQSDHIYRELIEESVRFSSQQGEIMVGVGDTCFARTRDRIQIAEQFAIDAVVVLSPYLVKFSQSELIDYFTALAEISSKPVFLYDLPIFTGIKLELSTVATLAKHPNIHGIKCSGAWEDTRQLMDHVGPGFRVIPAQPHLVDQLVRIGVPDNLDGIFGVCPSLVTRIVQFSEKGDWTSASQWQQKLSKLLQLVRGKYTLFGGSEVIMNVRGIPGRLSPQPMKNLNEQERNNFLNEELVQELIALV